MAFCLCLICSVASAQKITGVIADMQTGLPLGDVAIRNVNTGTGINTDSLGRFSINVAADQLIEFYKAGYKMEKVRVPIGILPPFFKIFLEKAPVELPEYLVRARDWKQDSLRMHDIYKHELEFPKMSFADMINHPFSAMSKKNRQIWAFQDEYAMMEQQKFVDYTFNETLVNNITGLSGDSVKAYIRMYRPSYDQVRNMSTYDFYNYINRTVGMFRGGYDPKHPPVRNAH